MVEIFKTNIQKKLQGKLLIAVLCANMPSYKINLDLSDCDKILRVEGESIQPHQIISIVTSSGYQCEVLL